MKYLWLLCILLLTLSHTAAADSFDHSHAIWNVLLQKHVTWINDGNASQVDYEGMTADREQLESYLGSLSAVSIGQFDHWTSDQQLAFLINAYNALTVKLILDHYPGIDSIRDTGSLFTSPWKKEFFQLLGDQHHLDWIEHTMIRGSGRYNEPLIHFAVNCASIGCPALLNEAFLPDRLEQQLLTVTRKFLQDRSRNRYDNKTGILEVSSIFDWYEEDFTKGWRGYDSLKVFFAKHAEWLADDNSELQLLRSGNYEIDFLEYDWRLNIKM